MTVTDRGAYHAEIQSFSKRLAGVPDLQMRVALWRELFEGTHPDGVLAVVQATLDGLAAKRDWARLAMLSLARFMLLCRDFARKTLLPAAVVAGATDVMALLTHDQPSRVAESDELRAPLIGGDRDVTLGERRSLARSLNRNVLERLLADPDPVVIGHLLKNPRIIERDVLAISSRRPTSVDVLNTVFCSDRWIRSRAVQLALIQNPYSPVDIALALVALVDEDGLRQVIAARAIHTLVRSVARDRLRGSAFTAETAVVIDDEQIQWIEGVIERREDQKE